MSDAHLDHHRYGHPAPGEALPDALSRIPRDESGLTTRDLVRPAFRHGTRDERPRDGELDDELCPVYRAVTDEPPCTDPLEVGDLEPVPWARFVHAVTTGDVTVPPRCLPRLAQPATLGSDPTRRPVADVAVPTAA
jgi:isopentenyl-diphosphate Delta-isomerase